MSESTTMVPPKTDRFQPQAIEAKVVHIPKSLDKGIFTVEAKVIPVETPKPPGLEGLKDVINKDAVDVIEPNDSGIFTAEDKALLAKLEGVIASNIGAFLLIGEALRIIKGRELQRILEPKLTFEQYCTEKWGFGQAYAYRLIRGYECVKHLKETLIPQGVTLFPTNEAQVRPLARLSPKDQAKAWTRILKEAKGGTVTATLVENVAHGAAASKAAKPAASKPEAKAEQNKLETIAQMVENALAVKPAKRSIKQMAAVLTRIQNMLKQ
jgi:hypothetical protein